MCFRGRGRDKNVKCIEREFPMTGQKGTMGFILVFRKDQKMLGM
jgi:hypothetical protein